MQSTNKRKLLVVSLLLPVAITLSAATAAQMAADGKSVDAAKTPELTALVAKNKRDLKNIGFIDKSDQLSSFDYIKDRMAERNAGVSMQGKANTPENLGFFTNEDADDELGRLVLKTKKLPKGLVNQGAERFLIKGQGRTKQFYTRTTFGAMLIDEIDVDEITFDEPNISIGGLPGKMVQAKSKGEKWSTIVYAQSAGKMYIFEVDKKLNAKAADEFLAFVTSVIE